MKVQAAANGARHAVIFVCEPTTCRGGSFREANSDGYRRIAWALT